MKFLEKHIVALLSAILFLNILGNNSAFAAVGTPSGKPGPVSTLSAQEHSAGDINWDVNWSEPTDTGGSPITGYTITILKVSDSSTVLSCTTDSISRTCLVTGLAYKTSYVARAFATNINGNGTTRDTAPFTTTSQSQTWTTEPVDTNKSYGSADFQLTAIASSGLPVTWSTSNAAGCTVDSSGVVHLVSTAGCTITYTQDGVGSPYNAITGSKTVTVTGSASTSVSAVTDIQSSQATLNGTFNYGGQNITPTFCVSTSDSISTSCSGVGTISGYSSTNITNLSSPTVTATVSSLRSGVTYYVWSIASPSGGTPVASPTSVSFTTTSGPTLTLTGTPTASVGQTITLTFTAAGGSGVYPVWDHGTIPTGFTFTPGVTEATITGSGISASSTPTWVSVSDSNSLSATKSTTIEITAASGGGGGSGGGGSSLQNQTITNTEPPSPASLKPGTFNLNGSASSGLPVTYLSNTPSICTVDPNGLVTYLAPGQCSITIAQAGNSSYAPASKTVLINIAAKLGIVLEEFANVQSTSATAIATADWPGVDADIKFCISLANSTADCTLPAGVNFGEIKPKKLTSDSGSVFSVDISGLSPMTNYYVWAEETAGGDKAISQIRKLHTPAGPTITYIGKTEYSVNEDAKIVFQASQGSGTYKNWKVSDLPSTLTSNGSGATYTTTGSFAKSGVYVATVSVMDSNGISASINVTITVVDKSTNSPMAPTGVYTQLQSATTTKVNWQKSSDALAYIVSLKGKVVGQTENNFLNLTGLYGPKSTVTVQVIDSKGRKSLPTIATYKAPARAIQIGVANFDLNKSELKLNDKLKLKATAKLISQEGFTSIQVSGYTDSKGNAAINTPLSNTRARNTFNYLQSILNKTALSVTLIGNGSKNPVASNSTKEGQAANRRAVIYLK